MEMMAEKTGAKIGDDLFTITQIDAVYMAVG
jgi:hypothetical protein